MEATASPNRCRDGGRFATVVLLACAVFAVVLQWPSPAGGQTALRPVGEPIQRSAADEAKRWTGHASYVFGYKRLSSDWAPADHQVEFGLVDFDVKRKTWPVRIAGQVLLSYSSNIPEFAGSSGDYSGTYEFNFGLRKVWDRRPQFHPFLGGGAALVGGSTTTQVDRRVYSQDDNDSGFGYWLGAGFYWKISDSFHTGLNIQYTHADITLFDRQLSSGGLHVNILLGTSW